jgi:hypothetical protein
MTDTNITPIRPLTDEGALDALRQAGGLTTLSAAELGRRWNWPEHRVRRRLKAWQKAGVVRRRGRLLAVVGNGVGNAADPAPDPTANPTPDPTPNPGVGKAIQCIDATRETIVDPTPLAGVGKGTSDAVRNAARNAASVTAPDSRALARLLTPVVLPAEPAAEVLDPVPALPPAAPIGAHQTTVADPAQAAGQGARHWAAIDAAAYAAAIGLAGCAAWFSIRGMTVLFPGAPAAIVVMTSAMEASKLITAGWLARRWRATARGWRMALAGFVVGLALINAGGTYSQLVAAHVGERGAAAATVETQKANLDARIEVASHGVADIDARIGQIDAAISEATRRGRTTGAMSIMDAQRRSRAGLVQDRNQAAGTLAALKSERASVAARSRQAETEAAPIRYVAELVGTATDSERAIRWLIALMVLCCDPLAIALTAAASTMRAAA